MTICTNDQDRRTKESREKLERAADEFEAHTDKPPSVNRRRLFGERRLMHSGRLLALVLLTITLPILARAQQFVYTNDQSAKNTASGFSIDANGQAAAIAGSSFSTKGKAIVDRGFPHGINNIVASPSGEFLFAYNGGSLDIGVFSIDSATGVLRHVPGSPFRVPGLKRPKLNYELRLSVTPDGRFLIAASFNKGLFVFAVDERGTLTPAGSSFPFVYTSSTPAVDVSPDGRFLAAVLDRPGGVAVFELQNDGSLIEAPGSPYFVGGFETSASAVKFSCDGRLYLLYNALGLEEIRIAGFDVAEGGSLASVDGSPLTFPGPTLAFDMDIDPKGRALYVYNGAEAGITAVRILATGALERHPGSPFVFGEDYNGAWGGSFSRDGNTFFVATGQGFESYTVTADGGLVPDRRVVYPQSSSPKKWRQPYSIVAIPPLGCDAP